MKTLKFKGFKADMILSGEKTSSMRLFDDKDLQVGDELELINSDNRKTFAKGIITEILYRKLDEISEADLEGHEKWENQEAMIRTHRLYYGDRVSAQTLAKIIRFKII